MLRAYGATGCARPPRARRAGLSRGCYGPRPALWPASHTTHTPRTHHAHTTHTPRTHHAPPTAAPRSPAPRPAAPPRAPAPRAPSGGPGARPARARPPRRPGVRPRAHPHAAPHAAARALPGVGPRAPGHGADARREPVCGRGPIAPRARPRARGGRRPHAHRMLRVAPDHGGPRARILGRRRTCRLRSRASPSRSAPRSNSPALTANLPVRLARSRCRTTCSSPTRAP